MAACLVQIKQAFRQKSLQCHPDLCPPAQRESAEAAFREIAEAYTILTKGKASSILSLSLWEQAVLHCQTSTHRCFWCHERLASAQPIKRAASLLAALWLGAPSLQHLDAQLSLSLTMQAMHQ